jgi:hypothetical protein
MALQPIKAENFAPLLGWIVMDMIANKYPEHVSSASFKRSPMYAPEITTSRRPTCGSWSLPWVN